MLDAVVVLLPCTSCLRPGFPPGPPGDQSLSLLSDPLACISRLRREHGPLVGLLLGGERVVLVADPAAAKQVSSVRQCGGCSQAGLHVYFRGMTAGVIWVWGMAWRGVAWSRYFVNDMH